MLNMLLLVILIEGPNLSPDLAELEDDRKYYEVVERTCALFRHPGLDELKSGTLSCWPEFKNQTCDRSRSLLKVWKI